MKKWIASKRAWILLAGAVLLPLAAFAQTTNISRPIAAGQMDLLSVPLIVPGGNVVSNVFPNVPDGSIFYFWDDAIQVWSASQFSSKGWPSSTGSHQLLPGEAFFFKPPGAYTVVLTGTPLTLPSYKPVAGGDKISVLGYFYPADIPWTNTQLASQLPPGSLVSFWNRTNSSFRTTFLKAPDAKGGGWGAAAANHIVRAGDGFAVKVPGDGFTWAE